MYRRYKLLVVLLALSGCTQAVVHDTHEVTLPVAVYPTVPTVVDPALPILPPGATTDLVVRTAIEREAILKNEMDARGIELNGLRHEAIPVKAP